MKSPGSVAWVRSSRQSSLPLDAGAVAVQRAVHDHGATVAALQSRPWQTRDPRAPRADDGQRVRNAGRPAPGCASTRPAWRRPDARRSGSPPSRSRGRDESAGALPPDGEGAGCSTACGAAALDRAGHHRVRLRGVGPAARSRSSRREAVVAGADQPSAAAFPGGEAMTAMQARGRRRTTPRRRVPRPSGVGAVWSRSATAT